MAQITASDVAHLAQLSNVSLTNEETDQLVGELSAIVGYISQLSKLDTTGVEPTYQVGGQQSVWQEDEETDQAASPQDLLAIAPSVQEGQIKVPKVL